MYTCFLGDLTCYPVGKLTVPLQLAIAVATLAMLVSLGIAIYTGYQTGGLLIERIIRIALLSVAILHMHLLPLYWTSIRGFARFAAFALWIVATAVVMYGQVTFFLISQRHAGDLRASTVPALPLPATTYLSTGRTRTIIAKEAAKVSTDLARAQTQRCAGDCPTLKVRRVRLAAEIAALSAEADDAKRREGNEDRRNSQADRDDDRRAMLRADPVASAVASWFGTTERRLELILGFACAVVLEGVAVLCWTVVAVAFRSDPGRNIIAYDSAHGAPECDRSVENEPSRAILSDDDQLLQKIHAAVAAGELKPTQNSIRKFLRCGQPKAGSLNRQYFVRFGSVNG